LPIFGWLQVLHSCSVSDRHQPGEGRASEDFGWQQRQDTLQLFNYTHTIPYKINITYITYHKLFLNATGNQSKRRRPTKYQTDKIPNLFHHGGKFFHSKSLTSRFILQHSRQLSLFAQGSCRAGRVP